MLRHPRQHTVYDVLEAKGVFESNSANAGSRNADGSPAYEGPVEYPKMLYSPSGESVVTQEAEVITTPLGPKVLAERRELVHRIVHSRREEEIALAEGWHIRPGPSAFAGGLVKKLPPEQAVDELTRLRQEMKLLQSEKEALLRENTRLIDEAHEDA